MNLLAICPMVPIVAMDVKRNGVEMIISEKQIMLLMEWCNRFELSLYQIGRLEEYCDLRELREDILKQQSEELKVIE
jgi:hypothetical protein